MLSIITIIGARPQFIKAAVFSRLVRSEKFLNYFNETIIHTGQHYDDNMSEIFFKEMTIPEPDFNLGIGGASHGAMTGAMLEKIEKILLEVKPNLVLVYGDTNSTLAGALAASKLNIPVVHIEAGLRSFDKKMPEEQNRILADHLSSYLFCPTETAVKNLTKEGITDNPNKRVKVLNVGDIMFDASLYYMKQVESQPLEKRLKNRVILPESFALLTLHRAENTDDPLKMFKIFNTIQMVCEIPIIFPVHPRTKKALMINGVKLGDKIKPIDPVGYFDMLELESACDFILTDSGGVQKEACFFRKPCITLRDTSEWIETIESGWNTLVGSEPDLIKAAIEGRRIPSTEPDFYGDGNAAEKIAATLLESY